MTSITRHHDDPESHDSYALYLDIDGEPGFTSIVFEGWELLLTSSRSASQGEIFMHITNPNQAWRAQSLHLLGGSFSLQIRRSSALQICWIFPSKLQPKTSGIKSWDAAPNSINLVNLPPLTRTSHSPATPHKETQPPKPPRTLTSLVTRLFRSGSFFVPNLFVPIRPSPPLDCLVCIGRTCIHRASVTIEGLCCLQFLPLSLTAGRILSFHQANLFALSPLPSLSG